MYNTVPYGDLLQIKLFTRPITASENEAGLMTRQHSRSSSIVTKVINHFSLSVQHLRWNIAYRCEINSFQRYDKQRIFSETFLQYSTGSLSFVHSPLSNRILCIIDTRQSKSIISHKINALGLKVLQILLGTKSKSLNTIHRYSLLLQSYACVE